MKSVENEWEQTAMKNAVAPEAAKTQQQNDRNNSKSWRSRITLRLKPSDTLPSGWGQLQREYSCQLVRRTQSRGNALLVSAPVNPDSFVPIERTN